MKAGERLRLHFNRGLGDGSVPYLRSAREVVQIHLADGRMTARIQEVKESKVWIVGKNNESGKFLRFIAK